MHKEQDHCGFHLDRGIGGNLNRLYDAFAWIRMAGPR